MQAFTVVLCVTAFELWLTPKCVDCGQGELPICWTVFLPGVLHLCPVCIYVQRAPNRCLAVLWHRMTARADGLGVCTPNRIMVLSLGQWMLSCCCFGTWRDVQSGWCQIMYELIIALWYCHSGCLADVDFGHGMTFRAVCVRSCANSGIVVLSQWMFVDMAWHSDVSVCVLRIISWYRDSGCLAAILGGHGMTFRCVTVCTLIVSWYCDSGCIAAIFCCCCCF